MDYDVTIIGAGVGGVFAAHELAKMQEKREQSEQRPLNILLIDKGKRVEERLCPLDRGESCDCVSCAKYIGFGGLGKSEGKFNYTNDFGGGLERKVGRENAMALMDEVDAVLCEYGGDAAADYSTENPALTERARQAGLSVLTTRTRHLGSALSSVILEKLQRYLLSRITMSFEMEVAAIQVVEGGFRLELNVEGAEAGRTLTTRKLVFATGRSGADWMAAQCQALGIGQDSARVDLGLRVEMRGDQLDTILGETFETKLQYASEDYIATTYCMNPSGRVIRKHQDGMVMPDGQNFRERDEGGSSNLNFTLFVPRYFGSMEAADNFARGVIGGINRGGERIVAQRLGDLRLGRATEPEAMRRNRVTPTLQVDPGRLTDEVPSLYTKALLDFLAALERLLGEPIDEDTMIYGIDGKFYAPSIEMNGALETRIPGLYAAGDCSGVTHSLSQAAASGIHVARQVARQLAGDLAEA
ncbi:NAD(P)/FAD-dependent oxidoreductase [Paenibacillus sp. NPDC058174]|uniref:NAD(P)/FAD-dependent oxidoreductase n=1 Tax=Paenibacillus sp. NPDC058174 TaxID=3346366 RepID=UPI0036D98A25